jgi:hypothetical protein
MSVLRLCGFVLTMVAAVCGLHTPASAVDAVLYEVTEAVKVTGKGGSFKSSTATLTGDVASGTALCPTWLTQQYNLAACTIVVRATGRADDVTGIGPAGGDFDVVIQDWNNADAPEIVVMRGNIQGTIDLSPAFQKQQPLGSITGKFTANGLPQTVMSNARASGTFSGTFRLPFRQQGRPSYLMDDGTFVPAQPQEFSLGQAMVRLEVDFSQGAK